VVGVTRAGSLTSFFSTPDGERELPVGEFAGEIIEHATVRLDDGRGAVSLVVSREGERSSRVIRPGVGKVAELSR